MEFLRSSARPASGRLAGIAEGKLTLMALLLAMVASSIVLELLLASGRFPIQQVGIREPLYGDSYPPSGISPTEMFKGLC